MSTPDATTKSNNNGKVHAVEWVLGGLSGLIVLGLAGFLVFEGITKSGGEPLLSLQVVRIVNHAQAYGVVIEVRNVGHATAAEVEIAGILAGDPLPRHAVLDYVPAESVREVTFNFTAPVSEDTLELFVLGFVDP
ncbi:hypothetical protein O9Z70_11020 [Devosia sp. YIM 151766]|uniref:hypothetical protein n=1 Tax=Devosia sp. YIM 151766 TaxID=3017325 RepID=UPI00255CC69A|nr:hypothetical protein [Devosia sp. YIM 151766]WIY52011.1 hypothetical protein O9Z70_11020 [Devosia sp. YIM 151766]